METGHDTELVKLSDKNKFHVFCPSLAQSLDLLLVEKKSRDIPNFVTQGVLENRILHNFLILYIYAFNPVSKQIPNSY